MTGCSGVTGHDLLALHVTPSSADNRAEVGRLAEAVQEATEQCVKLAYVDQGHTGERATETAKANGTELEVVQLPEAKNGFVLPPRHWVVERCFAWATRFGRLVKDYERYADTSRWLTDSLCRYEIHAQLADA